MAETTTGEGKRKVTAPNNKKCSHNSWADNDTNKQYLSVWVTQTEGPQQERFFVDSDGAQTWEDSIAVYKTTDDKKWIMLKGYEATRQKEQNEHPDERQRDSTRAPRCCCCC